MIKRPPYTENYKKYYPDIDYNPNQEFGFCMSVDPYLIAECLGRQSDFPVRYLYSIHIINNMIYSICLIYILLFEELMSRCQIIYQFVCFLIVELTLLSLFLAHVLYFAHSSQENVDG